MRFVVAFCCTTAQRESGGDKTQIGAGGQENDGTAPETGPKKSSKSKGTVKKVDIPTFNKLSREEEYVLLGKGTERAFTGKYTDTKADGTYICRRCNAALYNSKDKFHSGCGWPSFDDEIKGAVKQQLETDGTGRIEIVCNNCKGHLGSRFRRGANDFQEYETLCKQYFYGVHPQGKEIPKVIKLKDESDGQDSLNLSEKGSDSDKKADVLRTKTEIVIAYVDR
jgi:peptide-methionine (R)-S-oxide reductase